MTTKFCMKSDVVEAMRLDSDNVKDVCDWIHGEQHRNQTGHSVSHLVDPVTVSIEALVEIMRAGVGDWIIHTGSGQFRSCRPDVFEQVYRSVSEAS